jgi:hypothetical protein
LLGDANIDAQGAIMVAEGYLEQIRSDLESRGVAAQTRVCPSTELPPDGLPEVFIRHADLIVMATPRSWCHSTAQSWSTAPCRSHETSPTCSMVGSSCP